jgi:hypothetical protein
MTARLTNALRIADLRDGQLTELKTRLGNAGLTGDDLLSLMRMGLLGEWVDQGLRLIATEKSWGSARFFLPDGDWQIIAPDLQMRESRTARFDPARVAIQVRSHTVGGLAAPDDVSPGVRWVTIAEGVQARMHAMREGAIMVRAQKA